MDQQHLPEFGNSQIVVTAERPQVIGEFGSTVSQGFLEQDALKQLDAFTTATAELRMRFPLLHHFTLEELLRLASIEARKQ